VEIFLRRRSTSRLTLLNRRSRSSKRSYAWSLAFPVVRFCSITWRSWSPRAPSGSMARHALFAPSAWISRGGLSANSRSAVDILSSATRVCLSPVSTTFGRFFCNRRRGALATGKECSGEQTLADCFSRRTQCGLSHPLIHPLFITLSQSFFVFATTSLALFVATPC